MSVPATAQSAAVCSEKCSWRAHLQHVLEEGAWLHAAAPHQLRQLLIHPCSYLKAGPVVDAALHLVA